MSNELQCPYCASVRIKRNGYTIKGFQRFFCRLCKKYWQDIYLRKAADLFEEQKQLLLWAKQQPALCPYLISALPVEQTSSIEVYNLLFAYPHQNQQGLWIRLTRQVSVPPIEDSFLKRIESAGYLIKTVFNCHEATVLIESYVNN